MLGTKAAEFFAKHAGVTSFMAAVVNEPAFLSIIKHLSAAGTDLTHRAIVVHLMVVVVGDGGTPRIWK